MSQPCSECLTVVTATIKGRCRKCAAKNEKTRRPDSSARYPAEYRRNRRLLLAGKPACHWCGKPDATTADHLIPISQGGTHDLAGLVPSCKPCNSSRGNRMG